MAEDKLDRKARRAARAEGGEVGDLAVIIATVNRICDRLRETLSVLEIDLTVSDWLLLHMLKENGALSMSEASRRIGLSRQRVHQQTGPLIQAGLIAAGDGETRSIPLALTETGRAMLGSLEQSFAEVLATNLGVAPTQHIRNGKTNVRRIFRAMAEKKDDDEDEPDQ